MKIMGTSNDWFWFHVLFILGWVGAYCIFCLPCVSARVGQLFPNILAIGQSMHTKIAQLVPPQLSGFVYMCIDGGS